MTREDIQHINISGATWEYPGWLAIPCESAPHGCLSFGFSNGQLTGDDGGDRGWNTDLDHDQLTIAEAKKQILDAVTSYPWGDDV